MNSFKYITFAIIAVYIFIEIGTIVPQCYSSRTIAVYKRNYRDSNAYVKSYKTEDGSVEKFNVKVAPVTFWDRILLTDEDNNILSDVFKIAAAIAFAYYVYNLNYDNVFSKRSLNIFWLTLFIAVLSYISFGVGADHTKDFFKDMYIAKGGTDDLGHDFQANLTRFDVIHDWGFYWMPFIILNLYKTFSNRHEGKEDDAWT